MTRRPSQSAIDFLLIAINPILIGFLVASLVFFLITVFYQGDFAGRLWWTFAMYVMAVVCISRIAIEQGRRQAALFAAPMAAVTALAVNMFSNLSLVSTLGLLWLIWWSADRLTWDCTVIDDSQDSTGSGLLQSMGWELAETTHSDGVVGMLPTQSFRERWFPSRGKPHTPGVWVIYFSLAALPLFGLGQFFIPANDIGASATAFRLLVVYLACGLALLMTTTFLGLRRYLRQRGVEMPLPMAATWLSVGVATIGVLLLLSMLLPRPMGQGIQVAQYIISQTRDSSKFGTGTEAAQGEQAGRKVGKSPEQNVKSDGKNSSSNNDGAASNNSRSDANSGGKPSPSESGDKQGQQPGKTGQSGQAGQQSQKGEQGNQGGPADKQGQGQNGKQAPSSQSSDQNQQGQNKPSGNAQAQNAQQQPQKSPSSVQQDSSSTFKPSQMISQGMNFIGRALGYVILAVIIAVVIWKYWQPLRVLWEQLRKEFAELWQRLFGPKKQPIAASVAPPPPTIAPPPSFASFADPFQSGMAQRVTPGELVIYSFRALEAWARDHNCPRTAEQTPLEFAQLVATNRNNMSGEAQELAELYGQIAYNRSGRLKGSAEKLKRLWREMTTTA